MQKSPRRKERCWMKALKKACCLMLRLLKRSSLDETDADGDRLNVASSGETGEDMDIPGCGTG